MTINDPKRQMSNDGTVVSNVSNDSGGDSAQLNNIWSHILQEVQNSTKKSPPPKSIILLGDNESGRSTLISRLKGVESVSKGIGLEYHYIDIKDEDRDDVLKLGVWIPDGDGACTSLLKFALNESNFEHTLVIFVVSMSTPWNIMESLSKWSAILREHVKKLNIPEAKRNEYMKQQIRLFQTYQDPDENLNLNLKKQPPPPSASSSAASSSQTTSGSGKSAAGGKPGDTEPADDIDDDQLVPLDPFILNKNIGLPIAVIVTKSDYISILDKELDYRIEHFDFVQYHIRRFCLEYGASLFYTTIKDKRTYEKLFRYMIHKLYNYSFNSPASVVDREAIFIPSGWDNEGKINILLENSATLKSDSEYAEIIPKPTIRRPLPREVETILASEDQEFLAKLQMILNKANPMKPEEINAPQPISVSSSTPQTTKPTKPIKGTSNGTDSTNLKNFFQNLLNKNAPSSSTMTSPVSPQVTTGGQISSVPSSAPTIMGSNSDQQQQQASSPTSNTASPITAQQQQQIIQNPTQSPNAESNA